MDRIIYEVEPDLELETSYACPVSGCQSHCFDAEFAEMMGCAKHGLSMVRVVRQFQNGIMISEFRETRV